MHAAHDPRPTPTIPQPGDRADDRQPDAGSDHARGGAAALGGTHLGRLPDTRHEDLQKIWRRPSTLGSSTGRRRGATALLLFTPPSCADLCP